MWRRNAEKEEKMKKTVIDYDLTIADFFQSVSNYLKKKLEKAKDKEEYVLIIKNLGFINVIAHDPKRLCDYGNRVSFDLEPDADVFCKKDSRGIVVDNSDWFAFNQVLHAIDNYYNDISSSFDKKEHLLLAIKKWKYQLSTSFFKDIIFSFKSEKAFATKVPLESIRNKQY